MFVTVVLKKRRLITAFINTQSIAKRAKQTNKTFFCAIRVYKFETARHFITCQPPAVDCGRLGQLGTVIRGAKRAALDDDDYITSEAQDGDKHCVGWLVPARHCQERKQKAKTKLARAHQPRRRRRRRHHRWPSGSWPDLSGLGRSVCLGGPVWSLFGRRIRSNKQG